MGANTAARTADGQKVVNLNVGGKMYSTTLDTLCRDSNSMLAAMFSGRYGQTQPETSVTFIDRDGERFRHVLNYLRDGRLHLQDSTLCCELIDEAEFYGLEGLRQALLEHLEELERREEQEEGQRLAMAQNPFGSFGNVNSSPGSKRLLLEGMVSGLMAVAQSYQNGPKALENTFRTDIEF